ncbi:hypothetical protein BOTBODRAFT_38656, partial [Botryobasidium botryosum FD-172 SS1]
MTLPEETSKLAYTPAEDIPQIVDAVRDGWNSGKLRPIAYRKEQLLHLGYMIQDNTERFRAALAHDLGRPMGEADFLELNLIILQATAAYDNVEKWAKPEYAPFDIYFGAMRPRVIKEPKGVALIIGPFNYPVFCNLRPMIGAIAAGCAVVLKPSEQSSAVAALYAELFPRYLDPDLFRIVNGGIPETTKLLELQWDHILYTGSGTVGKIVATAAAKNLTPVTLELGGKSPVVIDPNMDLKLAARRLLWGKAINAGQTCVAPDYILCPAEVQDKLVAAFREAYESFYPYPGDSRKDVCKIISDRQFARLKGILTNTKGTLVVGGGSDEAKRWIEPTVLRDVAEDDIIMQSEIFGPILPIIPTTGVDHAIRFINARDRPLSLYIMSKDEAFKATVAGSTVSGSVAINDSVIQVAVENVPFGGVGPSGSGAYGGKAGFDTFTHQRSYIDVPTWADLILGTRFPPYTDKRQKALAGITAQKMPYPRPGAVVGWFGRWRKRRILELVFAVIAAIRASYRA